MKKIIALFAALTMLLGMFMLPLSAEENTPSLDERNVTYGLSPGTRPMSSLCNI